MDAFTSRVIGSLLTCLDQGIVPWRRPWRAEANCGTHTNVYGRLRYGGLNQLLLEMAARRMNLASQWWGTLEEWRSMGVDGFRGAPVEVVRYKASGNNVQVFTEYVYNCQQAAVPPLGYKPGTPAEADYSLAETLLVNSGAEVEFSNDLDTIYFREDRQTGRKDYIKLPFKQKFVRGPANGLSGYYDAVFHELAHWSEDRVQCCVSKEPAVELRAEMCAGFLFTDLHLVPLETLEFLPNHCKWLPAWKELLVNRPSDLFVIAEDAADAADYLLQFVRPLGKRHNPFPRRSHGTRIAGTLPEAALHRRSELR